ncbi:MAG: hypothetical protein A3A08_00795 [Candidatus Nealsonbacteria bacterium RIFCSPLOWO2_01_FULL_41_9]|uniref:Uncharacterized protein n=1 Tax=Candidatus Nealsonbacteria bacterium RIFCSPLOWO2_01_FULL_41_9 TaxID=1801671 RepID=A0A1G2ECD2_9BACT|nr:MAG: hypothetical protein A3A08_00795 [Candidatus Nealsonbacteria bacterium RIFCSPLOWO2_01_FULL_41_9]
MQFPLGFTRCPKCQKFSLNIEPSDERQIIEWECPFCFNIISEEEWEKNIVGELDEELERQKDFHLGQILAYMPGEITPAKAKELAIEYVKNLEKEKLPLLFENIRVTDNREEWQINFDEIFYCIIVNKKTGALHKISIF